MAFQIIKEFPTERDAQVVDRWVKNEKAGNNWYYSFMSRYPSLSLRTPEKLSHSRAIMSNEGIISHYYEELEKVIQENGVNEKPQLLFNCDESGFPLDFRPSKIVVKKGSKNVWVISPGYIRRRQDTYYHNGLCQCIRVGATTICFIQGYKG